MFEENKSSAWARLLVASNAMVSLAIMTAVSFRWRWRPG